MESEYIRTIGILVRVLQVIYDHSFRLSQIDYKSAVACECFG